VTVPLVKPRIRADLAVEELDGEAVIFDEANGDLHHLNPTATVVFGLCDGSATMHDLSTDLSRAFGVPLEDVESQVRRLVRQFRKANLLEPGRSERSASDRTETTPEGS
jgi:PqqD family protein of HPr-rel-A system